MKVSITTLLALYLFVGPSVVLGNSSRHRELALQRDLKVSEKCLSEIEALYDNQELEDAASTIDEDFDDLDQNFNEFCDIDQSSSTILCEMSPDQMPSMYEFEEICEDVGGKVHGTSGTVTCNVTEGLPGFTFIYEFKNFPECFSQSCDSDEVDEGFNTFLEKLENQVKANLGDQGMVAECDVATF